MIQEDLCSAAFSLSDTLATAISRTQNLESKQCLKVALQKQFLHQQRRLESQLFRKLERRERPEGVCEGPEIACSQRAYSSRTSNMTNGLLA